MNTKKLMVLATCLAALLVSGCSVDAMSGEGVAAATKHCLDSGGEPKYFHSMSRTEFTCIPDEPDT